MMWIIFASVSTVFIALLVLHHYRSPQEHVGHHGHTNAYEVLPSTTLPPSPSKDDLQNAHENLTMGAATSQTMEQLSTKPQVDVDEDPRLRIFEEL
jgi:hypothetical protein